VAERIAICEQGGATIVEVPDELREQMREAASDLYEEIRLNVADDELYHAYIGE
jgi:TRAP-type C4-dicarboxylate transport system substrate-binding protein